MSNFPTSALSGYNIGQARPPCPNIDSISSRGVFNPHIESPQYRMEIWNLAADRIVGKFLTICGASYYAITEKDTSKPRTLKEVYDRVGNVETELATIQTNEVPK